ncbi:unnamed protein product [Prorocentrum cordatum]|uniref:SET domain-containing protein n=1 Tax=Prorocentrum cordatum TaxID=2364126 RepID=A0ABN9UVZ6_9DINO|nr:unnamed protein product [Polarella glacialis]
MSQSYRDIVPVLSLGPRASGRPPGRVFLASFEHGGEHLRGLGVSSDVSKGEPVFCIPKACWINEDVVPRSSNFSMLCGANVRVALWLAVEAKKGPASFYYPYLAMLPTEEAYKHFHPAYLEGFQLDEQLDFWEGAWLRSLSDCHRGRESPTWEEAKLAYVQLLTRQSGYVGLSPLADLANAGPGHEVNVAQRLDAQGDFCLEAVRDLPAGAELLTDYWASSQSPALMFFTYGFALDREHHNETRRPDSWKGSNNT